MSPNKGQNFKCDFAIWCLHFQKREGGCTPTVAWCFICGVFKQLDSIMFKQKTRRHTPPKSRPCTIMHWVQKKNKKQQHAVEWNNSRQMFLRLGNNSDLSLRNYIAYTYMYILHVSPLNSVCKITVGAKFRFQPKETFNWNYLACLNRLVPFQGTPG